MPSVASCWFCLWPGLALVLASLCLVERATLIDVSAFLNRVVMPIAAAIIPVLVITMT